MQSEYLGIMVCETKGLWPFQEKQYFRQLCLFGAEQALQVYIFSPHRIDWVLQRVHGYTYCKKKKWIKRTFPLPDLIYDRCFYTRREQMMQQRSHIARLKRNHHVQFLGHCLKGKWEIQKVLMKHPSIKTFLPYSENYNGTKSLLFWLKNKQQAFLKPHGGSHGKRVLHVIRHSPSKYTIKGRDGVNKRIQLEFNNRFSLLQWIRQFIGRRKYIIQDYLSLLSQSGQAFDIRSLVQKNRKGIWQQTGLALRKGEPGSITSNLHGGGKAKEAYPFLLKEYGHEQSEHIIAAIHKLSEQLPVILELQYGRLLELGIDFGIDQQGRVWIIEVNSKPGRKSFLHFQNSNPQKTSIRNPIYYARYILDQY